MTAIRRRMPSVLVSLTSLCFSALLCLPVYSCNIPVFRYALERWEADDYELIVYFDGALSASSQQLLSQIENSIGLSKTGAITSKNFNLRIVCVQLNPASPPASEENEISLYRQYWQEKIQSPAVVSGTPYAVLRTSRITGQNIEIWRGELTQFDLHSFLNSPARSEISRRLLRGDSVVWVVVQSSKSALNNQVRQTIANRCQELSRDLELPEGVGLPGSELFSDVPLLLEFSILELDRNDRRESYLINLFSTLDPTATAADEPLVIPVFGRGRALEVIAANRLDAGLVSDLVVFLSGACSCQVKERNPGFDLLINQNWHKTLFADGVPPPPPNEGLRAAKQLPKLLEIPKGKSK